MGISDNLRKKRQELKLTQKDLGRLAGIKQPTISAIENGVNKPDFDTLVLLSDALQCTVSELMGQSTAQSKINDIDSVRLLSLFDQLNAEGKEKLIEQAEFFLSSPKYRKEESEKKAK